MTRPRNSLTLKGWLNGHCKLGEPEYAANTGDGAGRMESAKLARTYSGSKNGCLMRGKHFPVASARSRRNRPRFGCYKPGFLQGLPNKVITLDAPAEGCTFMWTPVRSELFKPKPWSERKGIICPVRLKNYSMRQKAVSTLEKLGVKIIERDDAERSYQDYVDDLCSAKGVINFCQDRKTGKPQVKGRVYEALTAGALLLEEIQRVHPRFIGAGKFS